MVLAYVLVDWAFGAVHVKIAVAFTLLGPNWWLRDALENIYNQESLDNYEITWTVCVDEMHIIKTSKGR